MKAWIYSAINPLVEALQTECSLLAVRNTTWRFYNRTLEFVADPHAYLDPNGQLILDDLIRSMRKERPSGTTGASLGRRLDKHAALVDELTIAAAHYQDWLVANPRLKAVVAGVLAEYETSNNALEPWGAFKKEQLLDLVAEHMVNRVGELPSNYTDAVFWKLCLQRLRNSNFPPNPGPKELIHLNETCAATETDAGSLGTILQDLRFELCERYDIPAAPVLGLDL